MASLITIRPLRSLWSPAPDSPLQDRNEFIAVRNLLAQDLTDPLPDGVTGCAPDYCIEVVLRCLETAKSDKRYYPDRKLLDRMVAEIRECQGLFREISSSGDQESLTSLFNRFKPFILGKSSAVLVPVGGCGVDGRNHFLLARIEGRKQECQLNIYDATSCDNGREIASAAGGSPVWEIPIRFSVKVPVSREEMCRRVASLFQFHHSDRHQLTCDALVDRCYSVLCERGTKIKNPQNLLFPTIQGNFAKRCVPSVFQMYVWDRVNHSKEEGLRERWTAFFNDIRLAALLEPLESNQAYTRACR